MKPTAKTQKNLIIAITGITLLRDIKTKTAAWFLPRDSAWAWLEARRPLFPQVSGQELITLALLPEDLRLAVANTMCGVKDKSLQIEKTDMLACQKPQFDMFTTTSAICLTTLIAVGGARELSVRFEKSLALMS